jgi:uncharacterized protein with von Willebrand factor type A (vWA) domain
MFFSFVDALRAAGIPASIKEHLTLLQALDAEVIRADPEQFYWLARATFVKDEGLLDRFDQVFAKVFKGLQGGEDGVSQIPEEWLRKVAELYLTPEQMAEIQALGSWEEIMAALNKRLEEQKARHQGGSKWIGTAGTSPFGAYGYNPEGVRIGQDGGRNRSAIKVWDKREFRNLDIKMRPERHNAEKLLLFLDVGGSMDPHVRICEELFSAATTEFKNLEFFYFHNCLYESVWKDNRRRFAERIATWDLLHKYGHDYKAVFVGDAAMSPYEISHPGGSVEHFNEESGAIWLRRALETWRQAVWLNPMAENYWSYSPSTALIRELIGGRMYELTLEGLDQAMRALGRKS